MRFSGVSAFLFLALAVSQAGAQDRQGRIRSLAEIRYDRVIAQQWDVSCGAAALAALLTYDLGDPVSERAVALSMLKKKGATRVRERGGFSLLDMQEYAESLGYEAAGYGEMSSGDLLRVLPAIVPVQFNGYEHFVVVRQIRDNHVFFADPAFGNRRIALDSFEKAWGRKVAFVVTPKSATR